MYSESYVQYTENDTVKSCKNNSSCENVLFFHPNRHRTSNGNVSEMKANESFDNGVLFDIEAKRKPSIVRNLFSKRSKHIR
jgi:hypothetical protein